MSGGLHNGELIILAARPSMGKTAFAMNVAENVALRGGVPVLFVSLEMSGIELADRLLCSVARVNGHRLRNGTISQEDPTPGRQSHADLALPRCMSTMRRSYGQRNCGGGQAYSSARWLDRLDCHRLLAVDRTRHAEIFLPRTSRQICALFEGDGGANEVRVCWCS